MAGLQGSSPTIYRDTEVLKYNLMEVGAEENILAREDRLQRFLASPSEDLDGFE